MYREALATTIAAEATPTLPVMPTNETKGWKFYTVSLPTLGARCECGKKTHIAATAWRKKTDQKDRPFRPYHGHERLFFTSRLGDVRILAGQYWPRHAECQPSIPLILCEADRQPIKLLAVLLVRFS